MNGMSYNGYPAVMTIRKEGEEIKLYTAFGHPIDVLPEVLVVYVLSRKLRNPSPDKVALFF